MEEINEYTIIKICSSVKTKFTLDVSYIIVKFSFSGHCVMGSQIIGSIGKWDQIKLR